MKDGGNHATVEDVVPTSLCINGAFLSVLFP